jgi:hypothetical protein
MCRYISEDHGGLVLHPIDILDVGTGALLDSLVDPNLQLINPVNAPHPTIEAIVTGSSGHLYCWRPEVRCRWNSLQSIKLPTLSNHQDHISIRPDQMMCIKTVDTSDNSLHQLFTEFIKAHQELVMFLMVT